jgi:hypothetical protein
VGFGVLPRCLWYVKTLFACPVCNQTAEVQDRLRPSPRGPITHVTVACVAGHWLVLPVAEANELIRAAGRRAT